jgi:hypothetical protein
VRTTSAPPTGLVGPRLPGQRIAEPRVPPGTCVQTVEWLTETCWLVVCAGDCRIGQDDCGIANCDFPADEIYDPGYPEPLRPGRHER